MSTSPKSTQERTSNGFTSRFGLNCRSLTETARTAAGPNRPPTRYVTPVSKGTPTNATSTSSSDVTLGSRANVIGPVNRGDSLESRGTYRGTSGPSSLFVVVLGRLTVDIYSHRQQ